MCDVLVADTKFKQQKLPAWQPIMTAGNVLPAFFAIGICFIPLGVGLLVSSNNVSACVCVCVCVRVCEVCLCAGVRLNCACL